MGYGAKRNRPYEWASKAQHSHVINDPVVKAVMERCKFPSSNEEAVSNVRDLSFELLTGVSADISTIIAVDGGYSEVIVKKNYPTSKVAFFQFGGLEFSVKDLEKLGDNPFIHPREMEKFKKLERFKLALPTKAASLDGLSILDSVRTAIIEFLNALRGASSYMDTLKWLIFHEFKNEGVDKDGSLASKKFTNLPSRSGKEYSGVVINKASIDSSGYFEHDGEVFNIVDVFRFHEVVDDELGASGILGYLTNVIEHLIILHCIRQIVAKRPSVLKRYLFIKDGPLGLFGQTARLHADMRELCCYMIPKYGLKLVGLEKSGSFVEHAEEITMGESAALGLGQVLPLQNNYIYKHILPGPSTEEELNKLRPYSDTSYYSGKLIYRSQSDRTWVMTLPTAKAEDYYDLSRSSFSNLDEILSTVDKLKCDMYDNAIIPIALANQLVSLANHPSSRMLEKFASNTMTKE
ncbi:hypothetical protein M2G38_16925 [Vibrio vulnificus]|nr:hypothetical protein [Vibrio vulnificus]